MGRINPNEYERYDNSNNGEWFSLKNDKDIATVQFLYDDYNDLDAFVTHKVDVNGKERHVNCLRNYGDPIDVCPFCAAGLPAKPTMFVAMYQHEDQKVKIWERGRKFKNKLESLFGRYSPLINYTFQIERNGAKGSKDTTYEVFPMPNIAPFDLQDVEKPEFLGTVILDKNSDDMDYYLAYNEFPSEEDNETPARRPQSQAQPTPRRGAAPQPRSQAPQPQSRGRREVY